MSTPPPDDPNPTPPEDAPPLLDYHNPHASTVEKTLSKMAVAALVTGVTGLAASLALAREVLTGAASAPVPWVELLYPLIPLVGIVLSMNALLRTADPMERLSGDGLAWLALILNALAAVAGGCCFGLRSMNGAL